jgi:uncharacterized Zn-binding protein involved in type VI secretion
MPPSVRLTDKAACPKDAHGCPACPHPTFGPAVNGSTNVFINKLPSIRLGDPGIHMACCGPNQWKVAKGSSTVYVNGKPIARMGDKTTHCGGDGKLINGSPNVFIDDGASGSMAGKLLKALEQAMRDALFGKNKDAKKGKDGKWNGKDGKGGKGGKDKKGKDGKGGKDKDGKDGKGDGTDGDISKDADDKDATASGGILQVKLDVAASPPEEKVGFTIGVVTGCKGTIKVEVVDKTRDEKVVSNTSVTADGVKKTLTGSFVAPALEADGKKRTVVIRASIEGKNPVTSGECVVTAAGLVLWLYDERQGAADPDPEGEEPTNKRAPTTVRLTTKALEEAGLKGPVKATVTIEGEDHEVTFNEDGIALVPPKVTLPKSDPGAGAAYDSGTVTVKILEPADMVKTYKVQAFAPGGGSGVAPGPKKVESGSLGMRSGTPGEEGKKPADDVPPEDAGAPKTADAPPPSGKPYETLLKAKAAADWKSLDQTNRLCLGRTDENAAIPKPDKKPWKNGKGWEMGLVGVEVVEKDGEKAEDEVVDGLRLKRIPKSAKLKVFDDKTGEVLVDERHFESSIRLVWDDSVTRIRIEASKDAKTWTATVDLPGPDMWSDAVVTMLVKK